MRTSIVFFPLLVIFSIMILSTCLASEVPANLQSVIKKTQSFGFHKYPIGFWNYTRLDQYPEQMNKAAVQDWSDVGFTVVMSPEYDNNDPKQVAHISKMLDWCKDRKIKMILCDPRCYAKANKDSTAAAPGYEAGVKAAVKDFGNHPALFGFHVGDEPDLKFLKAFCDCYRIQKKVAPKLHPFANLLPIAQIPLEGMTPKEYLDDYVRMSGADLLSYDCYTQMNTVERGVDKQFGEVGIDNYYENLRVFRDCSLRKGIPFWNSILSVGCLAFRSPTLDDIRWQFNTSICNGANGILWFFYYMREPNANYRQAPIDEFWQKTSGHYNLALVQKSFHKIYGDLFSRLVSTKVMFYGKVYGHGKLFAPDALISDITTDLPNHPLLIGEFADLSGKRYVMIVNNSQTVDVGVTVTFAGHDVKVSSWDWNGKEWPNESSSNIYRPTLNIRSEKGYVMPHFLAPGQEVVYRVESSLVNGQPITAE